MTANAVPNLESNAEVGDEVAQALCEIKNSGGACAT
jgi:hypothetical protein